MATLRIDTSPEPTIGELGGCCMAAVHNGPEACTCWTPILSSAQQPLVQGSGPPIPRPGGCCASCGVVDGLTDELNIQDAAIKGRPFYCHQGFQRVVAWVHPDGRRREEDPEDPHEYTPSCYHRGVPLKADGTPAFLCAAWAKWARLEGYDWFDRGEWPPEERR